MANKQYELTDIEWEQIKDLLPLEQTGKRGRPLKENRMRLNAMVWLARSGAAWRNLPWVRDKKSYLRAFPIRGSTGIED